MRMQSLATFPNFLVLQEVFSLLRWKFGKCSHEDWGSHGHTWHPGECLSFQLEQCLIHCERGLIYNVLCPKSKCAEGKYVSQKRNTWTNAISTEKSSWGEKKARKLNCQRKFYFYFYRGKNENQVLNRHVDPTLQMHLRSIRSLSFFHPLRRRLTAACSFWAKRASQRGRNRLSSKSEASSIHFYDF